jgi:hypothetical protein
MTPVSTGFPSAGAYAVTLRAIDPADPARIAGRLEHVLSGRRHDFEDAQSLLACLALERSRAGPAGAPPAP